MLNNIITTTYILIFLTSCKSYNTVEHIPSVIGDIEDSSAWYSDVVDDVIAISITIPTPNDFKCAPYTDTSAATRACTLLDVDNDEDANDNYEPNLHVNIQAPDFNSSTDVMNASFEQKGKSTRQADQKSYRVKLDSKTNLFRQERTLLLNKHPYDFSRVRNKLAFDLMGTIPNITTLKTQFVNLEINGSNYGLFTHIEKVGKEFLDLDSLDETGGSQRDYNMGINWYYNKQLRLMFNYIIAEPKDTENYSGRLQIAQARVLFAF
jgi:hypothetical protein